MGKAPRPPRHLNLLEADRARLSMELASSNLDSAAWGRRGVTDGLPQRVRAARVVHRVSRYNYSDGFGSGFIRGGLRHRMGHAGVPMIYDPRHRYFWDSLDSAIESEQLHTVYGIVLD